MYILLEGSGEYRLGKDFWPVKAGDILTAPAGGQETAHQLTNTGATDLRYLVVSTRNDPDVFEYPDSGKIGVAAGVPDGKGLRSAALVHITRLQDGIDYWDGEDIGEQE
jgi:uncharacterized cupin superfamily protein